MSILTNSPSPNKKNPDWNNQVKVGRGYYDGGGWHRAIDVAVKLFEAGRWDGSGLLVVHDPYKTHGKMPSFPADGNFVAALVEGVDYEFSSDSIYRREEAAEVDLSQVVKVCRASENWPPRFLGYLADGSEVAMTPAQFEQWMVL